MIKILPAQEEGSKFGMFLSKHNSILRTVESTLKPNQIKPAEEHDTKSHPAAKATTTAEFLCLARSCALSLLIKSVSHTTTLLDQTPRVGKGCLYSSVLGNHFLGGGGIKIKAISHILRLSEQLPPHRSRLPVWDPGGKAFCRLILRTSAWEGRNLKPPSDHFLICWGSPILRSYLNQGFLGWECKVNRVLGHCTHSLAPPSSSHSPWHISDAAQPGCLQEGNDIRSGSSEKNNNQAKKKRRRQSPEAWDSCWVRAGSSGAEALSSLQTGCCKQRGIY